MRREIGKEIGKEMRSGVFLLLCLCGATIQAAELTSKIQNVTVYSDGATVTRAATASLGPGANELILTGLPEDVSQDRLQVEVSGNGLRLGQITVDTQYRSDAFNVRVRELREQVDAVNLQLVEVADSTKTAQMQLKFLEGIAQGYAKESWFEGARGAADISSWRNALQVMQEGSDAAQARIRGNNQKAKQLSDELQKLQNELAGLRGTERASNSVTVQVSAPSSQTATVKVHYFVEDAYWQPAYEARLDSETGSLQLLQKARIAQTTSEPWPSIALTLSTSEPSGAMEPEQLESMFVDLEAEERSVGFAAKARSPSIAMSDENVQIEEVIVTGSRVESDVSNYAVNYRIPGSVSIDNESDDEQAFDLNTYTFDTDLITQIVPEASLDAFLTARFTYDGNEPLYANDMVIYVDGVYVGETYMRTALPGAEVTLPFGQDRRVTLNVRDQGAQQSEGGLISRTKTERTHLLFEVTNRRATQSLVEVYARVPVSKHREVEVELHRDMTEPDETDVDDRPGVMLWRNTLAPGGEWRIEYRFDLSYPADRDLDFL